MRGFSQSQDKFLLFTECQKQFYCLEYVMLLLYVWIYTVAPGRRLTKKGQEPNKSSCFTQKRLCPEREREREREKERQKCKINVSLKIARKLIDTYMLARKHSSLCPWASLHQQYNEQMSILLTFAKCNKTIEVDQRRQLCSSGELADREEKYFTQCSPLAVLFVRYRACKRYWLISHLQLLV